MSDKNKQGQLVNVPGLQSQGVVVSWNSTHVKVVDTRGDTHHIPHKQAQANGVDYFNTTPKQQNNLRRALAQVARKRGLR